MRLTQRRRARRHDKRKKREAHSLTTTRAVSSVRSASASRASSRRSPTPEVPSSPLWGGPRASSSLGAALWASHIAAIDAAEVGGAAARDFSRVPLALAFERYSTVPLDDLALKAWASVLDGDGLDEVVSANASFRRVDLSGVSGGVTAAAALRFGARASALQSFTARGLGRAAAPRWAAAIARSCRSIADVDVSFSPGMSDATVATMASGNGRQLQSIRLTGCAAVTDEAVEAIAAACGESLIALALGGCRGVSDISAQALAESAPRLEALEFDGCDRVSDVGVAALFENLPRLAQLSVRGCPAISDEGMQRISETPVVWGSKRRTFAGLVSLSLAGCNVSDIAVAAVCSSCVNLQQFDIARCLRITDLAFGSIAGLEALDALTVSGCPRLTDAGIAQLCKGRATLTAFAAAECSLLSDDALRALCAHSGATLGWIDASGWSRLTNAPEARRRGGIDTLAQRCGRALRSLELRQCTSLPAGSLASVGVACRELIFIDVSGCAAAVDDVLMSSLRGLKYLRGLRIAGCTKLTDDGLAEVPNWTLRALDASGLPHITDSGIERMARSLHTLEALDISGSGRPRHGRPGIGGPTITGAALEHLAAHCPKLEWVNTFGLKREQGGGITDEALAAFAAARFLDVADVARALPFPTTGFAAALDARLRLRVDDCEDEADLADETLRAARLIFEVAAHRYRGVRPAQNGAVAGRLLALSRLRSDDGASIVIQCTERCRSARKARKALALERELLLHSAASALQASFRGMKHREAHWQLLLSRDAQAVRIQRYFRRWLIENIDRIIKKRKFRRWLSFRDAMRMRRQRLYNAQLAANARRWYFGVQLRSWWTLWHAETQQRKQTRRNFALAMANARIAAQSHALKAWRAETVRLIYMRQQHVRVLLSSVGDTEEEELGTLNSAAMRLQVYVAVNNAVKVRQRLGMSMFLELIAVKQENMRRAKKLALSLWTGSGRAAAMLLAWSAAARMERIERLANEKADAHREHAMKKKALMRRMRHRAVTLKRIRNLVKGSKLRGDRFLTCMAWRAWLRSHYIFNKARVFARRIAQAVEYAAFNAWHEAAVHMRVNRGKMKRMLARIMNRVVLNIFDAWADYCAYRRETLTNTLLRLGHRYEQIGWDAWIFLCDGQRAVEDARDAESAARRTAYTKIQAAFRGKQERRWLGSRVQRLGKSQAVMAKYIRRRLAQRLFRRMQRHYRLIEFDRADAEHEEMEREDGFGVMMRVEYNAARRLQQRYRGAQGRLDFQKTLRAAIAERRRLAKEADKETVAEAERRRLARIAHAALIEKVGRKIQCIWRTRAAKKVAAAKRLYKRKNVCATMIGRCVRGRFGRRLAAATKRVLWIKTELRRRRRHGGAVLRAFGFKNRRSQRSILRILNVIDASPDSYDWEWKREKFHLIEDWSFFREDATDVLDRIQSSIKGTMSRKALARQRAGLLHRGPAKKKKKKVKRKRKIGSKGQPQPGDESGAGVEEKPSVDAEAELAVFEQELEKVKAAMVTSDTEEEDARLEARQQELNDAMDEVRKRIVADDHGGRHRPDHIQSADFMLMKRRPVLENLKEEMKVLETTPMEVFEKSMKTKELRGQIRSITAQIQALEGEIQAWEDEPEEVSDLHTDEEWCTMSSDSDDAPSSNFHHEVVGLDKVAKARAAMALNRREERQQAKLLHEAQKDMKKQKRLARKEAKAAAKLLKDAPKLPPAVADGAGGPTVHEVIFAC